MPEVFAEKAAAENQLASVVCHGSVARMRWLWKRFGTSLGWIGDCRRGERQKPLGGPRLSHPCDTVTLV